MKSKTGISDEYWKEAFRGDLEDTLKVIKASAATGLHRSPRFFHEMLDFSERMAVGKDPVLKEGAIDFIICIHELNDGNSKVLEHVHRTFRNVMKILWEQNLDLSIYLASKLLVDAEEGSALFRDCEKVLGEGLKELGRGCVGAAENIDLMAPDSQASDMLRGKLQSYSGLIAQFVREMPFPSRSMELFIESYMDIAGSLEAIDPGTALGFDSRIASQVPGMVKISKIATDCFSDRLGRVVYASQRRNMEPIKSALKEMDSDLPRVNADFFRVLQKTRQELECEASPLMAPRSPERPRSFLPSNGMRGPPGAN